jgi:hypothetical protein
VDLRLVSGDILLSCDPGSFEWGLQGLGTIEAYRIPKYPMGGMDLHVMMAYEEYLSELMSENPFLQVNQTYTRSGDWELVIIDTNEKITVVSASGFTRHEMMCQAIQKVLGRLEG